ncbi:MAG: energy transducer TonB [Proteobacteria bacterium]|nr:MAG: energy transducer TonB [Pseudomonadota bacterium]QKK11169.1 MAG: energy transducer TonB [Pseudomonadota bacterium]
MSAVVAVPQISARNRLELTLFVAAALHAVIILGVGFGLDQLIPRDPVQRMEITLVHSRSDTAPDDAKLLAQANQKGGGDLDKAARPTSPASTPAELPNRGSDAYSQPAPPAAPQQPVRQQVMATPRPSVRKAPTAPAVEEAPPLPDAATLMTRSLQMASLSSEINREWQNNAERPRQKFISASTREYKYAAYEEAWRLKIERIGNLNYPSEAIRRKLSGALMLDVAIKPDGSVHNIRIASSSGHKALDDAAIRIVHLAAPFAPFPPKIRAETDIVRIIRTWKFDNDYRLSSR